MNTIVAGGTGPTGSQNCLGIGSGSRGFNLEDRAQCAFDTAGDLRDTDPLLGPPTSTGGETDTLLPAADSPAIDAGDPTGCKDPFAAPLTTNQRGAQRPHGGRCDIGSVETTPSSASAPPPTGPTSPQPRPPGDGAPESAPKVSAVRLSHTCFRVTPGRTAISASVHLASAGTRFIFMLSTPAQIEVSISRCTGRGSERHPACAKAVGTLTRTTNLPAMTASHSPGELAAARSPPAAASRQSAPAMTRAARDP